MYDNYTLFFLYFTTLNFHFYHIENYHIFTMFENHFLLKGIFKQCHLSLCKLSKGFQIPNARVLLSENESLLLPRVTLSTSSLS